MRLEYVRHLLHRREVAAFGPAATAAPVMAVMLHRAKKSGHFDPEQVLARAIDTLRRAPEGTRNNTLNKAAFRLSPLVAGGHLDRLVVEHALLETALAIGLGETEAKATIASGLNAGQRRFSPPKANSAGSRHISRR